MYRILGLFILLVLFVLLLSVEAKAQGTAEAIIIEQPNDVIECEGSLDQYLFVVAAPSDKQYKIAYRWLKDGRPISQWVADFGQLTFDTLRYRMSGVYNAELFAYDPNWTSAYRNGFSYDSARVSPIVSSERVNLYVLQPPSFMKDIEYQIVKKGNDCIFTFVANIYGEHNMEDPTYWTDIQWFKDSVALIDGDRISGSQSSILTINNIEETDYSTKYRVRLSGNCDTIWSNEFAIYDEPTVIWSGIGIRDWGCVGSTVELWAQNHSSVPGIPILNQWYMDGKILEDIPGIVSGSKNDTLLIYLDTNNTFNYEAMFRNISWPEGYPNNSLEGIKSYIDFSRPPVILKDLEPSYTVEEGELLLLGIQSTGTDRFVYWRIDDNDWFWKVDTLKLGQIRLDQSGKYQAKVFNGCDTVWSRIAEVIVTKKPIITGIEDNYTDQEISIYPNPLTSNSTLTINPKSNGKVSVILADVLGNKLVTVYDNLIHAGQRQSINLNIDNIGLSSGTYFIIIQMGGKVETRQISVVR
ncbi:MAG: T9SS type A sorting domain-containing protein [Candidatus Kapaibacterium sp.]